MTYLTNPSWCSHWPWYILLKLVFRITVEAKTQSFCPLHTVTHKHSHTEKKMLLLSHSECVLAELNAELNFTLLAPPPAYWSSHFKHTQYGNDCSSLCKFPTASIWGNTSIKMCYILRCLFKYVKKLTSTCTVSGLCNLSQCKCGFYKNQQKQLCGQIFEKALTQHCHLMCLCSKLKLLEQKKQRLH